MTALSVIDYVCTHKLAHLVSEDQATAIGRSLASSVYRATGFPATVDLIDSEELAGAIQVYLALDVLPSDGQIIGTLADLLRDDLYRRTGLDFVVTAFYDDYAALRGPAISLVAPDSGDEAGGDVVTIEGAKFIGITAVKFDGVDAASFTVNDSTSITATTPAGTGEVDLDVTNAVGTATVTFTYNA